MSSSIDQRIVEMQFDNIAKFTATGKGLEESVTAMEGIALWAAASGQNATTASRAMYQLSQAMGAGGMRRRITRVFKMQVWIPMNSDRNAWTPVLHWAP